MDYISIGKYMSYLLRHHPETLDLKMDSYGYVDVDEFITKINNTKEYKDVLSREILEDIVSTNKEKRYSFNVDGTKIRAVQGHSFHVDVARKEVPPNLLYHGTSLNALKLIEKDGIKKMDRDYVHLSKNQEAAIRVGLRHGKNKENTIILVVDAKSMHEDGYDLYVAENGVWLTDFVPYKYVCDKLPI